MTTAMNSKEYYDWLSKFDKRNTSDDTFTPPAVYDCVTDYVHNHITSLDGLTIERPFYPGGDYQKASESYTDKTIVIDNPPFSIISQIIGFYQQQGVKFFLFAPALTIFSNTFMHSGVSIYACNQAVAYDNGARVSTSFVTNLTPHIIAKTAVELSEAIKNTQKKQNSLPKYTYPPNVLMMNNLHKLTKAGIHFEVHQGHFIRQLDSQKPHKKGLYGAGLLISDEKAKELQAKELQAKELQAKKHIWQLSDRERQIIDDLD